MLRIVILIPAAGASSRMRGTDKLLVEIEGRTLLERQIRAALASEAEAVIVTLPPDNPARLELARSLAQKRLDTIIIPEPTEGMSASIRAGVEIAIARDTDAMMILLPDMPDLTSADIQTLLDKFDGETALRAADNIGQAGHPVLFPSRLFSALAALRGDRGARPVLAGQKVNVVCLAGSRAITDLDTPEDWAIWRKSKRS